MALALNNLKRVDMPLNKETQTKSTKLMTQNVFGKMQLKLRVKKQNKKNINQMNCSW